MREKYAEPAFDVLIAVATGIAGTAYMLGILLDPTPAVILGIALVVLGATVLLPRERRVIAGLIGGITVVLAGVAVPRLIVEFTEIPDELTFTVALSGLVLLLSSTTLRIVTFSRKPTHPA